MYEGPTIEYLGVLFEFSSRGKVWAIWRMNSHRSWLSPTMLMVTAASYLYSIDENEVMPVYSDSHEFLNDER